MLKQLKNKGAALVALGSGLTMSAGSALAVDTTFDTSAVTTAATTVAGITGLVFAIYVAIKVGGWARRAL